VAQTEIILFGQPHGIDTVEMLMKKSDPFAGRIEKT
jgi:hypothetical protein